MAKALIHFTDAKLAPLPIPVPDEVVNSDLQLREYLYTQVMAHVSNKSAIRCIWFLTPAGDLRCYFPAGQNMECRTYSTDELLLASLDSRYAELIATGRMLQMLEDGSVEPIARPQRAPDLRLVS